MVQGESAVELYQDEAGGLYIFREGAERGFYMAGQVPGALFANDARAIAEGRTATWWMDLPRATRDQARRVGAEHMAPLERGRGRRARSAQPDVSKAIRQTE